MPESPETTGVTYAVDGEHRCLRGAFSVHPERVERARDLMTCQIGGHIERNEWERQKEVMSP